MIKGDPSTARSHQRTGFLGKTSNVGGGELDVVEDCSPADIGELMGSDACLIRALGPQSQ